MSRHYAFAIMYVIVIIRTVCSDCRTPALSCINGNCHLSGPTYRCACWRGYSGRRCERTCSQSCLYGECGPSQTCQCQCYPGFTGSDCAVAINYCNPDPCINGECINEHGAYRCLCYPGYSGPECQVESRCLSFPCMNNGQCTGGEGSRDYSCICPPGFTGKNCELELNMIPCLREADSETGDSPCGQNGVCINHVTRYDCACHTGYEGAPCRDIDECLSNPCRHGGSCYNWKNYYVCSCPSEYTGYNCEYGT
ncbi:unnamed protein product [Owenia fusiformis]|uniref:Uncharacterized protein n=1 Tax=Owenia fusiformis TaxID=6347 RepID=A0A8J1XIW8_OWEFU|nr:unnamed protein product [Owenia fusiformis]